MRWKIIFAVFIAGYALLMLINPNLGPVDDYNLLSTLQVNRLIPFYSPDFPVGSGFMQFGRFSVLTAMEYYFFGFFFKPPTAFWYFLFHAFQYVLIMVLFVKIISKFTSNKYLIYLPPILLSLTPAIGIPFFRSLLNERNLIFYYAIFLFMYLLYLEQPKWRYFILALTAANLALYYKEIGFVALTTFTFCHLIFGWKKSKLGVKILDGLVILSSFTYLLLYYFIVYRHLAPDAVLYNANPFNSSLVFIKNLFNYGFFSDPVLILILLPFTAWRIYKFLRRQAELHPVYDSMLIAASMFVLAYFVLNSYSPTYFSPAYIFALPPLIYFFSKSEQRTLFWKSIMAVCAAALIFNTLPAGIHYITYYKYLSVNFNKTLDFLIADINTKYSQSLKRANIFIDAVDANGGITVYFTLEEFLKYRGLTVNKFDFKSNVKTDENAPLKIDSFLATLPFSIFNNDSRFSEISKGDYLIITPDSNTKNITPTYIQSLNKDYDLVFKAESFLAFPNINLKILAKIYLATKLSQEQKEKGLMTNENLMQWPDYYVFIKR